MYSSYFAFSVGVSLTGKSSLSFFVSYATGTYGFEGSTFDSSSSLYNSSLSSSLEKSPSELTYRFNFSLNGSGDNYLLAFEASGAGKVLLCILLAAALLVLGEVGIFIA